MNRLFFISFVLIIGLFSCNKTNDSTIAKNSPYDGHWLWIGTSSGLFKSIPLVDSAVVLSINGSNMYDVTLNGTSSIQGTFTTDTTAPFPITTFNNVTSPYGNNTSGMVGNAYFISFNYFQVGRFFLFQNNTLSISGDTLTMVRSPIIPETPVSL